MADQYVNDVTPDTLMQRFQGKGLKAIIVFTLVAHVVILTGSSIPYFMKMVLGADTAKMTKEEKIKAAVQEASASIQKIAAVYGLNPQEISDQITGGGSRAAVAAGADEAGVATVESATPAAGAPDAATPPDAAAPAEPARPKSEIEKTLEVKAQGPAAPKVDDDIF